MIEAGVRCRDCGATVLAPPADVKPGGAWRISGAEFWPRFVAARDAHQAQTGHMHYVIGPMWFVKPHESAGGDDETTS